MQKNLLKIDVAPGIGTLNLCLPDRDTPFWLQAHRGSAHSKKVHVISASTVEAISSTGGLAFTADKQAKTQSIQHE